VRIMDFLLPFEDLLLLQSKIDLPTPHVKIAIARKLWSPRFLRSPQALPLLPLWWKIPSAELMAFSIITSIVQLFPRWKAPLVSNLRSTNLFLNCLQPLHSTVWNNNTPSYFLCLKSEASRCIRQSQRVHSMHCLKFVHWVN